MDDIDLGSVVLIFFERDRFNWVESFNFLRILVDRYNG